MPSGIGGWDISGTGDLKDVTVPENMGKSRDSGIDLGPNDTVAQHKAAVQLAYSVHGSRCSTCGNAQSEDQLCRIGQQLYAEMRAAGVVG